MFERVENRSPEASKFPEMTQEMAKALSQMGAKEASNVLADVRKLLCERYMCRQQELANELEFIKIELDYLNS